MTGKKPKPLRDNRDRHEYLKCMQVAATIVAAEPEIEIPEQANMVFELTEELYERFRARCARGKRCDPCKGTGKMWVDPTASAVCPACHGEGTSP